MSPARRPRGRPAAYPWRCRRGIAGRLPRQTVGSERGNHLAGPLTSQGLPGWREGPSSADAGGVGRRTRSSRGSGKPITGRRGPACSQHRWTRWRPLVNTGAVWPDLTEAETRVHRMQTKLHQWATADPGRRFDDLANLVSDPAFLVVAWNRVRGNRGARTAGVDGVKPRAIGPAPGSCWKGCEMTSRPAGSARRRCGSTESRRRTARFVGWASRCGVHTAPRHKRLEDGAEGSASSPLSIHPGQAMRGGPSGAARVCGARR